MAVLGLDLGGTKLAVAVFSETGQLLLKEAFTLGDRKGAEVGQLLTEQLQKHLLPEQDGPSLQAIGVSVPGISRQKTGTVWAPNIEGWEDYPLLAELKTVAGDIPVSIDSDRACYMLGELWQGQAKGSKDAIFLSVGTGIGAGILVNGSILRGAHDIAGAIGWMALDRPFQSKYISCGCFEHHASGEGIAKVAREMLQEQEDYTGELRDTPPEKLTAHAVFAAYERKDPLAALVLGKCISFWGMAVANLISIFNPEKIIFGGGVFGPASQFLPAIEIEAAKWAQPISMRQVRFETSGLGGDAGVYGAAYLALQQFSDLKPSGTYV
jgi:glucokinase